LTLGWRRLVNSTLNEELAAAEGGDPARDRMLLTLALALLVAAALKVVGVLLITAMLILPAAAARPLARTPEAMALAAQRHREARADPARRADEGDRGADHRRDGAEPPRPGGPRRRRAAGL
jgi:hypothetical protein